MPEIQNFDAKFTSNEANMLYNNVINCITTKAPYFNNSYRTKFTQSTKEKGDGEQFFVTKRPGFVSVPIYNIVGGNYVEETSDERLDGEITDIEVVDGFRYFLYLNKEKDKIRLLKQIDINKGGRNGNDCLAQVTEGYIVNISSHRGASYFPTTPEQDHHFTLTTYVKGKVKSSNEKGVAGIQRIDKNLFSYLHNEDRTEVIAGLGDFVLTYGEVASGLVMVVGSNKAEHLGRGKGIGFATTWIPVLSVDENQDSASHTNIKYKVFEDYGLTLHFLTSDGIIHWHYDNSTPASLEYTINGDTEFNTRDNTVRPLSTVHALRTFSDGTIFLNSKGALFLSGIGYNKFYFSPLSIIQTTGIYDTIKDYMGQILLIGPKSLGMLLYDFQNKAGEIFTLVENGGFYSKESFAQQDDKFFYVRDTNDLYELGLQFGYGASKPAIELGYRNKFLNTDMEMLQRGHDRVTMNFAGNNTFIFINDGSGNTKILFYDLYYGMRHKRYTNGVELTGKKHGVFFGKGVYSWEGTTDNGNPITQIITMVFGDQTHSNMKHMYYVKMPIGSNSYITKKSCVNIYGLADGQESKITYNSLGTSGYISNLLKIKHDQNETRNEEFTIRNYDIGLIINSAKGVAFQKSDDTLSSEIQEYLNTTVSEQSTDITYTYTLAKMGVVKVPIGLAAQVFTAEIICTDSDRIEFGGFFLGFTYTNINMTRVEDTLTDGKLTGDSGFTPPVFNNMR